MDKIKKYARSSKSDSTSPKGSSSNPYSQEEYYGILDSEKPWNGGYVEGLGYVASDIYIDGSYGSFSWDSSWDEISDPWFLSDSCSSSLSDSNGGGTSSGSSGSSGNSSSSHGTASGSNSGGNVSNVGTSSSNNLDKAFPEPVRHLATGSCVRVISVRLAKTGVSTLSKFTAVAYDKNGNMISTTMINGFFLEREINYTEATMSGHKKAILAGDYSIVPGIKGIQKYDWYLKGVPGREGIAIHKGNYYMDSTGCLLPGSSFSYDKNKKAYSVGQSGDTLIKLSSLFEKYGHQNIVISISEDF